MINEQVIGDMILTTCRNYSRTNHNPVEVCEVAKRLVYSKLRIMMSKVRSKDAEIQGLDFWRITIDAVKQADNEVRLREYKMDLEYGSIYR